MTLQHKPVPRETHGLHLWKMLVTLLYVGSVALMLSESLTVPANQGVLTSLAAYFFQVSFSENTE